MELWKPIEEVGGKCEISSNGRVRSQTKNYGGYSIQRETPSLRKLFDNGHGYNCLSLYFDGKQRTFYPHKLVAHYFICPRPFPGAVINHKDGNRKNNHHSNLEWVTARQNTWHARCRGSYQSKLKLGDMEQILERVANGESQTKLAKEYGVTQSLIAHQKRRWAEREKKYG